MMAGMLAHQVLTADGASPSRSMLFLHGLLGRGVNWRSVARRFVQARPEWAAVLVDLRLHGDSRDVAGPHTVEAAAEDLESLGNALEVRPHGVVGHSFGGKVALAWAARRAGTLEEVWLVDSSPSARPEGTGSEDVLRVLDTLASLPFPFESREDFVAALEDRGFSKGVAQWLATNLDRGPEGAYHLGLDLDAIHEVFRDYLHLDLWDQVEFPPGHHAVHVVVGGRSNVFSPEDRERLASAAQSHERVHQHVIEGAGHWIHVEVPDALLNLLTAP